MTAILQTQMKAAQSPSFTHVYPWLLQRKCKGDECPGKQKLMQRRFASESEHSDVPPIVHDVLRSPGEPLDSATRLFMESRFGHDFSRVRVHTGAKAAESSRIVNALAYTVGRDIVLGEEHYLPGTAAGKKLLAHELTHVAQQGAKAGYTELSLDKKGDKAEAEAEHMALTISKTQPLSHSAELAGQLTAVQAGKIQRQLITPLAPGGGFSGLMERDRQYNRRLMSTPFHVCARALQIPIIGRFANHAYIEAPPYRYAVIGPLCKPTDGGSDNVITGAVAHKWDNSPDPCGKTKRCAPCYPKSGVSDVAGCLRNAFNAYSNPSLYKILGPNSNTFAGTLARACCADMVPQPSELGIVPGWDDSPASGRSGVCPPAPKC